MEIKINKYFVRLLLYLSNFLPQNMVLVVCKGYGEDYELFTQLNWEEDNELDFVGDNNYKDFQLWISKFKIPI
jgi:hypothetical protein